MAFNHEFTLIFADSNMCINYFTNIFYFFMKQLYFCKNIICIYTVIGEKVTGETPNNCN